MFRLNFLFLLPVSFYSSGIDVYTCTKQNGTKVFSQIPCGKDYEIINIKESLSIKEQLEVETKKLKESISASEKALKEDLLKEIEAELPLCGKFSLNAIKYAHRAAVGMTKKEVEYVLGWTSDIRQSAYGNEVWTYKNNYKYEYVHFKNGCVTYWSR